MKHRVLICWVLLVSLASVAAAQQMVSGGLPGAEAWYLPTGDRSGELFVYEIGAGEPVVVLHGGPGGDLTYMLPLANGLEGEFRFVFYDQRGSLRSRVLRDSISMVKHVEDLETLRQALGAPRIGIISHSAGTLLAFEYLREHPDRVKNLVLVGALPHKNGDKYFDAEYAALWSSLATDTKRFNEREAVLAELRRAGLDAPVRTPKPEAQLALIRQIGADMFHVERWRQQLPIRVNPEAAGATRASTNFEYDIAAFSQAIPFRSP